MEGYSRMGDYPKGFPASATTTPGSSASSSGNKTEIQQIPGHDPRQGHEPSDSGRSVMSDTSSSVTYSAGNITVPDYRGSTTLGYGANLSEQQSSSYGSEPVRFTHHLPPTSSVSTYEPRTYSYHPGGYPIQPRQDLNYGQVSQSYIGQPQQSGLRTDSETYNAALALVQSQSRMFSDESSGQFYQLDSGSTSSSNYEAVHSNLVDNSSHNSRTGPDIGQSNKIVYVSENPQAKVSEDNNTLVVRDNAAPSGVDNEPGSTVKVVVETVEFADATNKPDASKGGTIVVLKADDTVEISNFSNNSLSDIASEKMATQKTLLHESQEGAAKTFTEETKSYHDTASQVDDGPELESRFGVLEEELKDLNGSKYCCIKLKPVKKSYLDVSCNSIVFNIEIDNELIVSSIQKSYLTEKTSNYCFTIMNKNDPKATSETVENDSDNVSVSGTVKPSKETTGITLSPTNIVLKEPQIKIERVDVEDKIMTRASKRKMAQPLKKTVLKQPRVGKSRDTHSSVEVKVNDEHEKTSKSSKKDKEIESHKREKESKSPRKEKESKKKISKSKSKSPKEQIQTDTVTENKQTDTDLEEAADRSDDFNIAAENIVVIKTSDNNIRDSSDKGRKDTNVEVKPESDVSEEIKTDGQIDVGDNESKEKVIIKQKRKRKKDSKDNEGKPKRAYQKRQIFSQTELNYTMRKTEGGKRIYTCPKCNRDFNQVGNVQEHIRIHTGERPFVCTDCGKSFRCKSNLNSHMIVHQTERNVICKECGFAFKDQRSLKRHMKHHANDRKWICDYCGKAFYENCQLAAHQRVHTGERPYPCKHCPRMFRNRSAWIRHMDIHSGRVIHQCHFCGRGFSRKDNYITHLKQHESGKEGVKEGVGRRGSARGKDSKTQTPGNVAEEFVDNEIVLTDSDAVAIRVPEGATAYSVTEGDRVQKIYFVVEERGHVGGSQYLQPSVVTTPHFANYGGDVTYHITNTGVDNELIAGSSDP